MTEAASQVNHSSDEIVMSALAHGSVLLSFFGPIGPILVWISQRKRSSYAAFHALQALGYQMAFFWIGTAVALLLVIFWMLLFLPEMIAAVEANPENAFAPLAFQSGFMLMNASIFGIYFIGGAAGAVTCMLKKDFRYPWLGKRLEKYLRFDSLTGALDEAMAERFVAAMSHASAILLMWGLLSPLAVWATQKDHSPSLRFQGLQATVYQFLAVLGYFAFMAMCFLLFVVALLIVTFGSDYIVNAGDEIGTIVTVIFLVMVLLVLLIAILFSLTLPTYHLFAMIAGIQILKGKDYKYPLLGNFIAHRMNMDERQKDDAL